MIVSKSNNTMLNNIFVRESKISFPVKSTSSQQIVSNDNIAYLLCNDYNEVADTLNKYQFSEIYVLASIDCISVEKFEEVEEIILEKSDYYLPNLLVTDSCMYLPKYNLISKDSMVIQELRNLFRYFIIRTKESNGTVIKFSNMFPRLSKIKDIDNLNHYFDNSDKNIYSKYSLNPLVVNTTKSNLNDSNLYIQKESYNDHVYELNGNSLNTFIMINQKGYVIPLSIDVDTVETEVLRYIRSVKISDIRHNSYFSYELDEELSLPDNHDLESKSIKIDLLNNSDKYKEVESKNALVASVESSNIIAKKYTINVSFLIKTISDYQDVNEVAVDKFIDFNKYINIKTKDEAIVKKDKDGTVIDEKVDKIITSISTNKKSSLMTSIAKLLNDKYINEKITFETNKEIESYFYTVIHNFIIKTYTTSIGNICCIKEEKYLNHINELNIFKEIIPY